MKRFLFPGSLSLAVMCGICGARADVSVPGVFSDHMVLQRDMAVPVWGRAGAGEKVTVTFRGQEKTATAGDDGAWRVKLDALAAGGPEELVIAGATTITIRDVLVGEVWVGSGQSNMAGAVRSYAAKDETLAGLLAGAPYPRFRLLRETGSGESTWSESTPEESAAFSALLFAFGHRLHEELDVPVGLIVGAVGGTPSGSWLSAAAFKGDKACRSAVAEFAKTYSHGDALAKHEKALAAWEAAAAKAKEEGAKTPRKPAPPVRPGEGQRGPIGNLYERFIRPVTGYGIRGVLWDQGEAGTAVAGVDQFTLMGALIRGWRDEWGQGEFPFLYVQKPSGGGCAWDYANPVTREADAFAPVPESTAKMDGAYRALHIRIREHPHTWMVSASDLGPMVHPINKWGYGDRAAQVALHAAYGKDVAAYGPTYASHAIEGGVARVRFENTGKGLAFRNGDALQGFQVAGEDKVFHWAKAEIDGDTVIVSAAAVPAPVAVRYAWSQTHPWANLFNKDGLPALTFRTDKW